MRKTNKIDIAIIVFFLMILFLPHILYFFMQDILIQDDSENRNLATKPVLKISTLSEFPSKYDAYFNDNLPFRRIIKRLYNNICYYGLKINSLNNVVIGKKSENNEMQWLFYDKKEDGDPLQFAMGTKIFSDYEKNSFVDNIIQNTKKLKDKNIELYYFVAPNKSTIYKEYLPNNIEIKNDKNTTQDLYEYIKNKNIDNFVYPYKEFMEAKNTAYTYYSLDTHWNLYGGFIAVSLLQNKMDSQYKYLFNNANIQKKPLKDGTGDLSKTLNMSGFRKFKEQEVIIENFLDDSKYSRISEGDILVYTNENALIDKEIVIIGDSYSEGLSENFAKMYSKITYLPFYAYNEDYMYSLQPDIVIVETVERYIDNIVKLFNLK